MCEVGSKPSRWEVSSGAPEHVTISSVWPNLRQGWSRSGVGTQQVQMRHRWTLTPLAKAKDRDAGCRRPGHAAKDCKLNQVKGKGQGKGKSKTTTDEANYYLFDDWARASRGSVPRVARNQSLVPSRCEAQTQKHSNDRPEHWQPSNSKGQRDISSRVGRVSLLA